MSIEETIKRAVQEAVAPLVKEVAELRRALAMRDEPSTLTMEQLRVKLGKPTRGALHTWLSRHPSFPRRKVGERLVFDREAVDAWLAKQEA